MGAGDGGGAGGRGGEGVGEPIVVWDFEVLLLGPLGGYEFLLLGISDAGALQNSLPPHGTLSRALQLVTRQ